MYDFNLKLDLNSEPSNLLLVGTNLAHPGINLLCLTDYWRLITADFKISDIADFNHAYLKQCHDSIIPNLYVFSLSLCDVVNRRSTAWSKASYTIVLWTENTKVKLNELWQQQTCLLDIKSFSHHEQWL